MNDMPISAQLPSRFEIESQLFGLIKVLADLDEKYHSGEFSVQTYREKFQEKIEQFLELDLITKRKGLVMDELISDISLGKEYEAILPKIREFVVFSKIDIESAERSESNSNKFVDLLENDSSEQAMLLAKLSAAITSDFITILDFFELALNDNVILKELATQLGNNLGLFPEMEDLALDYKMFCNSIDWAGVSDQSKIEDKYAEFHRRFKEKLHNL